MGALLIGVSTAKALAGPWASPDCRQPHGGAYHANMLDGPVEFLVCLRFPGHTELIYMREDLTSVLGQTRDDTP